MTTSWELFDQAAGEFEGTEARRQKLSAVLAQLEIEGDGTAADREELRGCVLALQVGEGQLDIEAAGQAVQRLSPAIQRSGWLNYHMAESAHRVGRPDLVLAHLTKIPADYFVERDLQWRATRCRELEAMASVDLSEWKDVERLVEVLANEFENLGDEHDLVPPKQLVTKLLATPKGRQALATLDRAIDLNHWVGGALATQIQGRKKLDE